MPIQNGFEWTQSCNFHSNDLPNLPFSVSLESHKQANDIFRNALSSQQFANETLAVTRPCPLFSAVQINLVLHYRNPLLALSQYLFVFFRWYFLQHMKLIFSHKTHLRILFERNSTEWVKHFSCFLNALNVKCIILHIFRSGIHTHIWFR